MVENRPVSKVLVLDDSPEHIDAIKAFCDENNLIGLKVKQDNLLSVLRSNIDLGAILLAENYGGSNETCLETAMGIHKLRAELPIILRRSTGPDAPELPEALRRILCAEYFAGDMTTLQRVIHERIFTLEYPAALVRGISEITQSKLNSLFSSHTITSETPYIVRDRIIFGEVFSLIPLESTWCRGYMMIQAEEVPLLHAIKRQDLCDGEPNFRDLNSLLGELTNLIWGAFKNRYVGDMSADPRSKTQVPLLINHKQKYISFGSENPQLCFRYQLADDLTGRSFHIYQRFIFSLSWSPEDFAEIEDDVDAMVEAGELDLF
jgi:hypothetical protein